MHADMHVKGNGATPTYLEQNKLLLSGPGLNTALRGPTGAVCPNRLFLA